MFRLADLPYCSIPVQSICKYKVVCVTSRGVVLGPGLAKAIPNAKVHQIPSSTDTFPYPTPWRVALHNASDSLDTKKSAAALTA